MANRFGVSDSLLNAVMQTMQEGGVSRHAAFGHINEAAQPKWKVAVGNKHYTVTARNTAEASKKAMAIARKEGNNGVGGQITKMAEQKMDPVNKKALEKDFDDREDKDIDNDGDEDESDEYLHNRRKAVKKAMKKEEVELDEDITKMSHGRLKWHMNTGVPHGSYTKDEMKKEKERRMKHRDTADAYRAAKPGLSEQSKDYGPGHIGAVQKMLDKEREAKKAKTLTNSKKDTIELNPKEKDYNKGEM